ncbi:hypothetical protein [Sulfuracidifex metallicus]|uniref:hypothetical protein n=1 Tax=Sulfuracidifex metallicus TaxID=47303 RepID=UPI0022745537|nr:hypothetical protein [Sulfuracidifex metallicus]MCY0850763.1 hypothetical protein [Sulfuracidifex metallicus]
MTRLVNYPALTEGASCFTVRACQTRGRSSIGTTSGSHPTHEPHRSVPYGTDGTEAYPMNTRLRRTGDAYSLVTVVNRTLEKKKRST